MKTKEEIALYNRKYYQKNRDSILRRVRKYGKEYGKRNNVKKRMGIYLKEWNKNNNDKVKKSSQKWRESNREKMNKSFKKYRQSEKGQEYRRKYGCSTKTRYNNYKNSAIKRNLLFSLTIEEFGSIISRKCYYCGDEKKIGVDRKDNNIGYLTENCVPCCWTCNRSKGSKSEKCFLSMCKKVYEHKFGKQNLK